MTDRHPHQRWTRCRFIVWWILLVSDLMGCAEASGNSCRSEIQKQVYATASYADCSAASGLRLDKKLKKKDDNDPTRSAFCGSSACLQVFMQLQSLGALACLQEYGTSSMPLWLETAGPACFGSAAFEAPAPVKTAGPTPTPTEAARPTVSPIEMIAPAAPVDEEDPFSQASSGSESISPTDAPPSSIPSGSGGEILPHGSSFNSTSEDNSSSSSISSEYVKKVSRTSDSAPSSSTSDRRTSSVLAWLLIITGLLIILLVVIAWFVKRRRKLLKEESSYVKGASTARGYRAESRTVELSLNVTSCQPTTATEFDESADKVIHSYRIPTEKLAVGALLSRGGYGEVYEGTYREQAVAIKTLLPDQRKSIHHIQNFLQEIKLLASLEHERIVQFIGVAWDSLHELSVVMEFMEGGDLRTLLQDFELNAQRSCGFDAQETKIALQVAHGLVYLHSLDPVVVHRDLKSRNILLDAELNAKLADFGVSREVGDSTMTAGVGSSLWMAPEVMLGERYDERADIFSFGVVLSELDRHVLPYSHAVRESNGTCQFPQTAIMQMVSAGQLTVAFTDTMHCKVAQLGLECVALDPAKRPRASEVLYRLHQINKSFRGEKDTL